MYNFLLYFDTKIYKVLSDSSQSREREAERYTQWKKNSAVTFQLDQEGGEDPQQSL